MTVTWVIEKDTFPKNQFNQMITFCEKTNTPYKLIKIRPFEHTVVGEAPKVDNPVIPYGSYGIGKVAKKEGWEGFYYMDDEATVKYRLSTFYLNWDMSQCTFDTIAETMISRGMNSAFIKPIEDSKDFAGCVKSIEEVKDWSSRLIDIGYLENGNIFCGVSSPKLVGKEWRVVLYSSPHGTNILGSSLYRDQGETRVVEGIPREVEQFVEYISMEVYAPQGLYVMDVCEDVWAKQLKVIEYNCFNSVALYGVDIYKMMSKINEIYS